MLNLNPLAAIFLLLFLLPGIGHAQQVERNSNNPPEKLTAYNNFYYSYHYEGEHSITVETRIGAVGKKMGFSAWFGGAGGVTTYKSLNVLHAKATVSFLLGFMNGINLEAIGGLALVQSYGMIPVYGGGLRYQPKFGGIVLRAGGGYGFGIYGSVGANF